MIIFITHFGPWPAWIDFFVESCKKNSDIDWVLISDNKDLPRSKSSNVKVMSLPLAEYTQLIGRTLGIDFQPDNPYKVADVRPAFGVIHRDLVGDHDFFGYGDIDVIYGRIRDFYTSEALARFSVLSTHPERLCGHFALLRNIEPLRNAFRRIPSWRTLMEDKRPLAIDEDKSLFLKALYGVRASIPGRIRGLNFLFEERYSSPVPTEEMRWYWKDGILTNEFYGPRGFMYLHFMHWKSSRWYLGRPHVLPGATAPWERLPDIVQLDWRRAGNEGFMISPQGIQALTYRMFGQSAQSS